MHIDATLHRLLLDQLASYRRAAQRILTEWDEYSDTHTDAVGWPLDDTAYGRRQRQRDADTWKAFTFVRGRTGDLLEEAARHLATIPTAEWQPQWRSALTRLDEARVGLENTTTIWQAERDALPANAVPGTEAYDEPLAERNADAWGYLTEWTDCSHVLSDIAQAAAARTPAPGITPSAEHTHTRPGTALPPQIPGRPHPGHRPPSR